MNGNSNTFVTILIVVVCFASSILTGCTGVSFQGGDVLKNVYSARVDEIKTNYANDGLKTAIHNAKIDPSGTTRNEIINDFIFLIDNNYYFSEKHLYNKKAYYDFGTDVAAASLSTASGVLTGGAVTSAKSILALVAGGLTSTRASFNQNILQSQNLLAIVAKMRAQRAAELVVIQTGMYQKGSTRANPLENYSLDQAFVDLANYYQAGTFVSALQAIIDSAGKQKTDADQQTKDLKGVPSPTSPTPSPKP